MRYSTLLSLLLTISLFDFALGQTLTEKLLNEDPAALARQARENGNVVRGAILFHQGNINCAKCHRPQAEVDRIGPDLAKLKEDVTDESIIESILRPSQAISEGYETIIALTVDGLTINGIQVSENESEIVIRDNSDVDKLITLSRDDLEAVRPGKLSSMPEKLADELKNRQQFLDLLRYVFVLRERGPETRLDVEQRPQRRRLQPRLEGVVALQKYNCAACHASGQDNSLVKSRLAPQLQWSARNLNPDHLVKFIADPHGTKTGTPMPDVLARLNDEAKQLAAQAISSYLLSEFDNQYAHQIVDAAIAEEGFELFHSVGCVACHSPRDATGTENQLDDSLPLGDVSNKYNLESLVELLEDPLAVRSSGHMPNMGLSRREAINIASFLLQNSSRSDVEFSVNAELVADGKAWFESLGCAACHDGVADQAYEFSSLELEKLDPAKGCMSDETGNWPKFAFDLGERESIAAALESLTDPLDSNQQISITLRQFNCLACHDRGDLGGVSTQRNPHFKTTNLNLGDQGRLPPTLTDVGAKLKTKWLRDVMVNGRRIRPYMNTRMPQYGEENIQHLFKLFDETDHLIFETEYAKFADQKETRKWGLELAGSNGLNCVACHTYKYKISDTMPAVDLTEMAERLEKDWFYQYMLDPQSFSPNTVMPSFWPGGKAIRADLQGTPEDQIEALWQYLIDGRQAGTPRGVVREPLEIVVADEARLLRRSFPGIGKRGIAVGYPGGVNIAFDAEQMRLASVWKGKFVDPGGAWTGQGSGNVRPLGPTFDFTKGPDLDSAEEPWVVDDSRPPNHRFKGYTLDEQQRPTFLYQLGSVQVEDYFAEQLGEGDRVTLRRTIKLTAGQLADDQTEDELRIRLAENAEITELEDGAFQIGGRLTIRILGEQQAEINRGEPKQLVIRLESGSATEQELNIEYEWD